MEDDTCGFETLGFDGSRTDCFIAVATCGQPAIYEMDIDRDERWIPLCIGHGPTYRGSSNVRIRTRRATRATKDVTA